MTTVTTEQIENRIADALVEFGVEREALDPSATLEELDVDSLDLFELAQILEQEFGFKVNHEDFEGIQTLGDAQRVLLSYAK